MAKELKPEIYLQYRGRETGMKDIVDRIKQDYASHGHEPAMESLEVYIKPDDSTAYYVVNESIEGKVSMF